MDAEVVVVGGGVAGTTTALQLARAGVEVILVDRAHFPRPKVCGEGLMPSGVAELARLGIQVDGFAFGGITYGADGIWASGRFPRGLQGLGVRRDRFDVTLNEAARQAGVQLRHGVAVSEIRGRGGRMEVYTDEWRLRCRVVVAADGMRSPIRKQLGLSVPLRGRPRFGLRGHVVLPECAQQLDTVWVQAHEGWEVYLTPVGPRALNVAFLLEKGATQSLKGDKAAGFASWLARAAEHLPVLQGVVAEGNAALVGPLRQEALDTVADGVVLVGDAGGFLDGITGEGMSLSLISARLASETLVEALRQGDVGRAGLKRYAERRKAASRDMTWMTELVLGGIRHRWLAKRVIRGLRRHPDVFERLLGVSAGGRLVEVGLGGLIKVLR